MCLLAGIALGDRAVTMDGVIHEGDIVLDAKTVSVTRGTRTKTYPRDDFYLVERDDGTHLWSPDVVGRLRGYEFLAREHRRGELTKLLRTAISAEAPELARRILELAEADGWTGKRAESAREKVAKLERKGAGAPSKSRKRRRAEVEARLPDVIHAHARLLAARARAETAKDPRREVGLVILRRALRLDPKDAGALALLAKAAPKSHLFDARRWLDWHLDLEASGARLPSQDGKELAAARKHWRKDLHEVRAGPIRLITPVRDTRVVRRCLAHARLATAALQRLFAGGQTHKRSADALTLFLYDSRQAYLTVSGTGRAVEARAFLEQSAGHYDGAEGISRLFWSAEPALERRIAAVAIHEFTHHWIDKLCPRIPDDAKRNPLMRGFWIVEGFAVFMEEGRYDVEGGRWQPFHRRLRSLDIVRALGKKKRTGQNARSVVEGALLPWSTVYAANQVAFIRLSGKQGPTVLREWAMGASRISQRRLFYEQAAATCHYLYHAEDGRYRKTLVDCLVAHYTGDAAGSHITKRLGLAPHELGAKVVAFANRVADGWRPKPR